MRIIWIMNKIEFRNNLLFFSCTKREKKDGTSCERVTNARFYFEIGKTYGLCVIIHLMRELHCYVMDFMYQTLNCANLMTWQWVWSFVFSLKMFYVHFETHYYDFGCYSCSCSSVTIFLKMYENAFYFHENNWCGLVQILL